MFTQKFLIQEEELEYIVEKGKRKAVILKIDDFKRLLQFLNKRRKEKIDGAKALWSLLIEFEKDFDKVSTPLQNISSNYKELLYGKDGILK